MTQPQATHRDRWWQWLLPGAILRADVRILLISRLLSELGMATLTYGAMIYIARQGASQIEVSVLTTSGAVAALVFGLRGGAIADSLPRRIALGLAYLLQAALCVVVPMFLGTTFVPLLLLIFTIRLLTQIVSPAIKAAVSAVATATELGGAISLLTIAGGIGSGVGNALIAPTLIRLFDIRVLLWAVAAIMLLAAVRTLRSPGRQGGLADSQPDTHDAVDASNTSDSAHPSLGSMGSWLTSNAALSSIILSGAVVAVLADVFVSLQSVFVRDTLGTDPANSVYVFAPGLIGIVLALVLGPLLVRWPGERWLIGFSLFCLSLGMVLLGLIQWLGPYLAPYSPLHLLASFGLTFSEPVLAAGLVSIPIQFGQAASNTATQAFINRKTSQDRQGATFGMQSVLQNAIGVVATLVFGFLADQLGTPVVFVAAPIVVTVIVSLLIRRSVGENRDDAGAGRRSAAAAGEP